MVTDRKFLRDVGFIRPAIKDTPHLRIPKEFYETIGDLDAFTVYVILKSGRGSAHNWTTKRVKAEIDKRFRGEGGRGVGRNRVEKALALLKREGWIRYVDLMEPNGQQRGSVIEVHYVRLPEDQRGKNRKIRFRPDGKFTMHEHDGTVVPPKDFETKSSISKKDDPAGAPESTKGAAVKDDPTQPHHRNPGERSPGDRVSVEQYKGDDGYKGNIIEESPCPLSRKGDSDFLFDRDDDPGEKPVEPTGDPLQPEPAHSQLGEPVRVSPAPDPAPFDVQELWRMADAIKGDADRRYEYEAFLFDRVFPALKPPPEQESRKRLDALEWCRTSAMGRLFLSMSKDADWAPELARRFANNCGTFTPDSIRTILLTGKCPRKLSTLKDLLNTGRSLARDPEGNILNHWKALCEWACEELKSVKRELQATLEQFSAHENDKALLASAVQFRERLQNETLCYDYDEPLVLAVHSFRKAFFSNDPSSHLRDPEFIARRDEQRLELQRAFASNLPFLTVARSIPNCSRVIWGVKDGEVLVLRWQTGQKLKRRAEIHGIPWDADFLITTTKERCRRIISQMPSDSTAIRLANADTWNKTTFPE